MGHSQRIFNRSFVLKEFWTGWVFGANGHGLTLRLGGNYWGGMRLTYESPAHRLSSCLLHR